MDIHEQEKKLENQNNSEDQEQEDLFVLRDDWITLNVGGKIYETTRQTLISQKDSMLERVSLEQFIDTPLNFRITLY